MIFNVLFLAAMAILATVCAVGAWLLWHIEEIQIVWRGQWEPPRKDRA